MARLSGDLWARLWTGSFGLYTTKGGSRRLEKSHKVWMMMIAASLIWAGAAEEPEKSKNDFQKSPE